MTQVIVLNGGSSSGKSGIARCLQTILPSPWLLIGVDTFIETLPAALRSGAAGIDVGSDGGISIGPQFHALEAAWRSGAAAMVRAGARIVVDDVFLSGGASQRRWREALDGLDVVWVGVRCAADVAAGREIARGDRVTGMAAAQAELVHDGVRYDLEVDTTRTESLACATEIAAYVTGSSAG